MSKVTTNNRTHKVIRHNNGRTEVWGKDSAGCTRKERHSTYNPNTGNTSNHYGRIVATGGRDGRTKSKR